MQLWTVNSEGGLMRSKQSGKGSVRENVIFARTLIAPMSPGWLVKVKRIRGKKLPLTAVGVHALRDEYTRTIKPACALAAETLTMERTLSNLVNQAYALTPAEIALMW